MLWDTTLGRAVCWRDDLGFAKGLLPASCFWAMLTDTNLQFLRRRDKSNLHTLIMIVNSIEKPLDPRVRRLDEVLAHGSAEEGRDERGGRHDKTADRNGGVVIVIDVGRAFLYMYVTSYMLI